jgi:predicted homoserine dehydrogenase-like protein
MIIVDTALKRRAAEGRPVRAAIVGAGYMGRGVALQIESGIEGMTLVGIASRTLASAQRAFAEAGVSQWTEATTADAVTSAIASGHRVVTEDAGLLCRADDIEVIIEVTGTVEHGAQVALDAIDAGKHVVLVNAELDATIGPILKRYADKAGVVLSNADGDEPGVIMNLFRFVSTIGYRPVLVGNLKGFFDPRRNPETQRGFATATGQEAKMVTSFADGTKLSMETCIVANATGFKVGRRGMLGPSPAHVKDVMEHFDGDTLLENGLVDYVLGAEPGSGAFVVGYNEHPIKQQYMSYFKMGDGPFYVFYRPFHLPHLEAPLTAARAVLFHDAAVAPLAGPACDVITIAKRDLHAGETLDGIGGFLTYGTIENYAVSRAENLLPMGLSEGCRLLRDVEMDQPVGYADVELPEGRLADKLRGELVAAFGPESE